MICYCSSCQLSTTSDPSPASICPKHYTIFIRASGYCSSDHVAVAQSDRLGGVGVFFGLFSQRNISECVPREISIGSGPLIKQELTSDRMDLWSAIRAIDAVLEFIRGTETLGWKGGRPTKVGKGLKEVVLLMQSEYVIHGMLMEGKKPWHRGPRANSKDASAERGTTGKDRTDANASDSKAPALSMSDMPPSQLSYLPPARGRRTWFGLRRARSAPMPEGPSEISTLVQEANASPRAKKQRRGIRIKSSDWDLFKELEELALELEREGIKLLFWTISNDHHGGAVKLAKEGALKPKIYGV